MPNSFAGLSTNTARIPVSNPLDSDTATLETVTEMVRLARINAGYPQVRAAVDQALAGCNYSTASRNEIATRIWEHVKRNVRFVQDEKVLEEEFGVSPANELLIEPSVLLSMREPRGDCDDFSMLTAAMLLAAGLPAYFVTIAADGNQPNRFSHVYVGTTLENGEEFALDTSHGNHAGWEKLNPYRKAKWLVWQPLGEVMARNPEDKGVIDAGFPGMRGLGEVDWGDVISTAIKGGTQLTSQLLAPQTVSGQYAIKNGMLYQMAPGQTSILPSGGISTTMLIALGIGAIVLVAAVGGRR